MTKKGTFKRKNLQNKSRGGNGFFRFFHYSFWTYTIGAILFFGILCGAFYYFFIDSNSFRWRSIFHTTTYPEGYNVRGIDVSHYQEEIDWLRLRNASMNNDPISFVIVKATEGVSLFDQYFNENFYQAKANGLIRGAYHFYIPTANPREQAKFYLRQVHLEQGDLPPIIDVEEIKGKTASELRNDVKIWLDIVENQYGAKPILYTSYKFFLDYFNTQEFQEYPLWIAHYYVPKLRYKGKWVLWQHTDCGKIDGIKGKVDCNIFNGSLRELHDFTLGAEE